MGFEPRDMDLKVRTVTRVERQNAKVEVVYYKLVARDKEGINEMTITSAEPFKGISPVDGVIQVTLKQSQKTIDDFKKKKEEDQETEE